jgi:hypothetical protein
VGAYTDLGDQPPTSGYDHPQIVEFLRSDPDLFRIDSRTDVWDVWQPNLALLAGFYDVSGIDNPLVVADVARYLEGTDGRSSRLYDLLGARYVLGSKDVTLDWNKFSLAFEGDPTVNVYRNESTLPRAFVVHRAIVATDHEHAWALIHQDDFDPATTVVLEGGQPLEGQAMTRDRVQVVRYESNALEIDIQTGAEGYLFLSDPFYPGWRAELDDEPTVLMRANYAFRAVRVPAGSHRVTMTFWPGSWIVGLASTLVTLLLLVVFGGLALLRRVRQSRSNGP